MATVELFGVSKTFHPQNGSPVEAVRDLSCSIQGGEFLAFVGPSGCGKSTILQLLAGLIKSTRGEILVDRQSIHSPHQDRGLVFQQASLFPWLTVAENIAFGLRLRDVSERSIQKTVRAYLRSTQLEDSSERYPSELSGGMQQRAAIARTLANDPGVLLLDEPFGALDAQTRAAMQEFLADLVERERKTVVLVTHDIEEAMFLADRVVTLTPRPSRIQEEFLIPFARPRLHDLKLSDDFFYLKRRIMKAFESQH